MDPDYQSLNKLYRDWQIGMQKAQGWNAVFWCNHDQPRVVSRLGDDKHYWKESAKMLATSIHMLRGTPYIYQGEEIGMTNVYYTDISQYRDVESLNYYQILLEEGKTREEALEILGSRSRDNGRTPMQWDDIENAGFTSGTPWINLPDNYKTINVKNEIKDRTSIHRYYKELIAIRKTKQAISEGEISFIEAGCDQIFAYKRVYENQEIVVVCNWKEYDCEVKLEGCYHRLLGNYEDGQQSVSDKVLLRPYECYVLEK